MDIILIIAALGFVDILGRVAALYVLMKNGKVRKLNYRTWVLLCALLNFAWVVYFIIGREKNV